MSEKLNKEIENEFIKNITVTPDDKDEIWNNIEDELFQKEHQHKQTTRVKKGRRWAPYLLTVAASAVILVGIQTDTGFAVIDKIKTMFANEKEITQQLEGNNEETKVMLEEGSKSNYVIYIDETRYKMEKTDEMDIIVPREPLGEKYPEVSMSIQEVLEQKPEVLIEEYAERLKETGVDVSEVEKVESPIKGWIVRGLSGHKWDSKITRYYILENGKDGSFVVTQNFFLEAEEGHGARMNTMLEEFHIIE